LGALQFLEKWNGHYIFFIIFYKKIIFQGPLWTGVVTPDRAPAMDQIAPLKGLFSHAGQSVYVWGNDRQVGNIFHSGNPRS